MTYCTHGRDRPQQACSICDAAQAAITADDHRRAMGALLLDVARVVATLSEIEGLRDDMKRIMRGVEVCCAPVGAVPQLGAIVDRETLLAATAQLGAGLAPETMGKIVSEESAKAKAAAIIAREASTGSTTWTAPRVKHEQVYDHGEAPDLREMMKGIKK